MVTVVGLGFVGLTTALGFAEMGYKVYGVEADNERLTHIKNGKVPFFEPHLDEALEKHNDTNFIPTDTLSQAVKNSQYIFYCVGTPCGEDGNADLSFIYKAIEDTLSVISKGEYKVLVIKSTIPSSTTKEKIIPFIESLGFEVGKDVGIANNPEFLREGYSWDDFINPDRIVIGQSDTKVGELLECLYKPFNVPVYKVSLNTGEFIKYLSNTLLATMISYANDMSILADTIGDIEIANAFKILHLDKRWHGNPCNMKSYVYPGCGFGGYCLPKDTQAFYCCGKASGYDSKILKAVIDINNDVQEFVVEKISQEIGKNEYIGILGLSFKPNSDDIREAPSKFIIEKLLLKGYKKIIAYDPMASKSFESKYKFPIEFEVKFEDLVKKVDNVIILTSWDEFLEKRNQLVNKKVFDFRYMLG